MKKAELYGYFYDFLVDYDSIDVSNIFDIHKYLTKRRYKMIFGFIEKIFIRLFSVSIIGCLPMSFKVDEHFDIIKLFIQKASVW